MRNAVSECVCNIAVSYATSRYRMRHCGIHAFQTALSPSDLFFLGKPAWTLESAPIATRMERSVLSHSQITYTVAHVSYVYMFSIFVGLNLGLSCVFLRFASLAEGSIFFFRNLETGFA